MKLARILLASVILLSAAACSSDRITAPDAPARPASTITAPHGTIVPGDSTDVNLDTGCTTRAELINGVLTLVVNCDSGWLSGGGG
ncbi:MAG TPA: hypothetical protein VFH27_02625 [Longimicrobiaceae bacterium]|nr:hypothetical protein [Longimicrobiaceae bacterium]